MWVWVKGAKIFTRESDDAEARRITKVSDLTTYYGAFTAEQPQQPVTAPSSTMTLLLLLYEEQRHQHLFLMPRIVYLTTLLTLASASCPDLAAMNHFNVSKFPGIWYNQYSRNTPLEGSRCMVSNYTYNSETGNMKIESTYKTIFGNMEHLSSTAVLTNSTAEEGSFTLTYVTPIGHMKFSLKILTTDYSNFVIMYSCMNILGVPYESSWVLTRNQEVNEETLNLVKKAMIKVHQNGGPSFSQMKRDSQKNC